MSLCSCSAIELLGKLQTGEILSVDLTSAFLRQIAAHDAAIHAFVRVDSEAALARAAEIDERRRAGRPLGALAGLPVAIKDNLCTQGEPTTCASRMLEHFSPPYDATVVARLKQADAVLIGKTNMDEFAMGGTTETSYFGPTCNPWDTRCVPGGSSGGAAAALAAGMAPLSVASDTGGSIRQPAAFCGVTGLKPTYGRISRYGLVAFASSLDQIGPLGRSVPDVALLLNVLAAYDPLDSTSAQAPVPDYLQHVQQPLAGLTVGIVREHFGEGLDAEVEAAVREAVRVYQSRGAQIREISLPHSKYAIATYYIIAPSEASSNLARYDGVHYGYRTDEAAMLAQWHEERRQLAADGDEQGLNDLDSPLVRLYRRSRAEGFGAEVKRRIMLGTYALSAGYYDAYYLKALRVRRLIREDFDAAFRQVDVIAGPVAPTAAYLRGEKIDDPLAMYLGDLYTVSANLAGLAAISLPCGFTAAGLPIGLQLQSPPMHEERLLRAANMFQHATDWHTRTCPLLSTSP